MISVALRYQQEHRTTKYMTMTISPYSWIRNAKLATSTRQSRYGQSIAHLRTGFQHNCQVYGVTLSNRKRDI